MKIEAAGYPAIRRAVAEALSVEGATVSVAESCTGGMLATALTDLPGSSQFFHGGVVAYANDVKVRLLGVQPGVLTLKGAVSRETAEEMAMNCLEKFKTDYAVSVTGIAGPDGGTKAKPVGLVYIGVAHSVRNVCRVFRHRFEGSRRAVREASRRAALLHLLDAVGKTVACACLCACVLLPSGAAADVPLYGEPGGWGVAAQAQPDWLEVATGRWMGRLAEEAVVEPLPSPPIRLSARANIWRGCMLRTLSVRYADMLEWTWTRLGESFKQRENAFMVRDPMGREWKVRMELEDVVSGEVHFLEPARRLQRGRIFEVGRSRHQTVMYIGSLEDGAVSWQVIVAEAEDGRLVLQGHVASMDQATRFFVLRVGLDAGENVRLCSTDDQPMAVISLLPENGWVGLMVTPEEPRRCHAWRGTDGTLAGLAFALACTPETVNFAGTATFGVELLGDVKPLPPEATPADIQAELDLAVALHWGRQRERRLAAEDAPRNPAAFVKMEPSRLQLTAAGGFRDAADALAFLAARRSGLFADSEWFESAEVCLARDATGEVTWQFEGDDAVAWVNCDPDFETGAYVGEAMVPGVGGRAVNLRRNRAALVNERSLQADHVWIKAMGRAGAEALDAQERALRMTDYPAVWTQPDEAARKPAAVLALAESEMLASLACVKRNAGGWLWVEDDGPWAPYTTLHADGLVCASADEAEMRRQFLLAGARPVLWVVEQADAAAVALAKQLGFLLLDQQQVDGPKGME